MQANRARRAVAAIFLFFGTFIGLWASRIPDIKRTLGLDDAQFGLLLLAMASGAVMSFPAAGRMVDRIGSAKTAKSLAFVTALTIVSLSLCESVWVMAPLVFITGWFIGILDVSMNGWGAEVEAKLGRPVMSSFHGVYSIGAGVGAAAGAGALRIGLSVPEHFIVWAIVVAGPLVYAALAPWLSPSNRKSETKTPLWAVPKGALFFVGIMALVAALGEGGSD